MLTSLFPSSKWLRPTLWGFFISCAALALLFVTRMLYGYVLERRWEGEQAERTQKIEEIIQKRFAEKERQLLTAASQVHKDQELFRLLRENSSTTIAQAFTRLNQHRTTEGISLDIVDPRGAIVLWSGRSVASDYQLVFERELGDSFVVISHAGLHKFLSVGIPVVSQNLSIVASQPLEVNYPLSNRFVSRLSFSDDLSKELGTQVRLLFDTSTKSSEAGNGTDIPLTDFKQGVVARATFQALNVSDELQEFEAMVGKGYALAGALAIFFLGIIVLVRLGALRSDLIKVVVMLIVLWTVRTVWKAIGFPSIVLENFLSDPTIYAAPFFFDLTSSLGELFLSCITLFLTSLCLFLFVIRWEPPPKLSHSLKKLGALLVIIVLALGIQWTIRGFGASVRSFVFDSTLGYQDPGSLVPEMALVVMHLNILIFTGSLLIVMLGVVWALDRLLSFLPLGHKGFRSVVVFVTLLSGYGVFLLINRVNQTPVYYPILLFFLGVLLVSRLRPFLEQGTIFRPITWKKVLIFSSAVFVLSALLLDAKLHEKERQRVQVLADELVRPVDHWLSFIVSDGLRSAVSEVAEQYGSVGINSSDVSGDAFNLWAQTLMSKEGYNSGVFMYNNAGKEISRFSVGMTSYEQFELLSRVFDSEEEALHVFEKNVAQGAVKYYGAWSTVRDEQGQVLGTLAVVLSASQRSLFRGEAPEPLRSASRERFEQTFRRVSISEFQDGDLVSTTDETLSKGMKLDSSLTRAFEEPQTHFVWSERSVGGRPFEVLYAKDQVMPSRVLAVSLEPVDVRWHLFNLVKMLTVYVFFFVLGLLFYVLNVFLEKGVLTFGFREKLIVAFAILAVLPLILMAYYNRELAIERLDANISHRLSDELDLIQQRILNTVADEEDFTAGVNNDYCEVVASDLGVDFSVYGRTALQASSRPELYSATILDSRLTGTAFVNAVLLGRNFFKDTERIGEVDYVVGYRPLYLGEKLLGVLAVPALYRLREIDEELAQRNAFVIGAYAFALFFIVIAGIILANRLSRPLRELSKAATMVGAGNLDVQIEPKSTDEVGDLVKSFNEMTKELKANRENLARVERELAWKEMAKQVAHEIKNPLTPMKLSMQHLLQAYKDGVQDFGHVLQRVSQTVIDQIETLSRIASEFSNFARMPERRFERVEVNQLLKETIHLFNEVHGIEFRTKFSETPLALVADADELRRVFINLVRNSVQAMQGGGVIAIETEAKDFVCRIAISDTGSGIPKELQAKVFQPNFSTKTDGMGIGLAITQKVIQDLNGSIELHSEMGKGTTIEMKIPLTFG